MSTMPTSIDPSQARKELLQTQSRRFSYFQAVRELETLAESKPRVGHAFSPSNESFRIGQAAELTFAPTAIDAARELSNGTWQIEQRFFGLLGPSGPLPSHLTETVRNRSRHAHDPALHSFLNLFHHRMAALFYRAWSDARPAIQRDRPWQDRYATYLASLAGVGLRHARNRDRMPDDAKSFFTGRLASLRRNGEGLEAILSTMIAARVSVHPFALRWLELPNSEKTKLGGEGFATLETPLGQSIRSAAPETSSGPSSMPPTPVGQPNLAASSTSSMLGRGAVLGSRIPDRQSTFEVNIGPLSRQAYEELLPSQHRRTSVEAVLKNYAPIGTDARVRLTLNASDVHKTQLGKTGILGRTSWIASNDRLEPRSDYSFHVTL